MRATRISTARRSLVSRAVRATAVGTLTVGASCLLVTSTAFADNDDSGDPPQSACVTADGSCNGESTPSDTSSSDDTPTAKQVCRAWEEQGSMTFNQKDQNWCRYMPGN
ncbi:MAG TPA: hypothetical protein VFA63_02910 [Pseudonocardiaceae bacterium]|nr:hypothetical protein [Pseudonocardiaceae bacterium]